MKKLLTVVLAAALALAFALPVQAADAGSYLGKVDFSFRGWYGIWGWFGDNEGDFDTDRHDKSSAVYQRFRVWFDTNYMGKYGGTLGLEANWTWGQDPKSAGFHDPDSGFDQDVTEAPGYIVDGTGDGPRGDDRTDNLRIKHAYIWFLVPGTPVKMTAGLQGIAIEPDAIMHGANGDWFAIRLDAPLIKGMLNISSGWLKQDEGKSTSQDTDDSNIWYVNLTGSAAKWFTFGTYFEWLHVNDGGMATFDTGSTTDGLGGRPGPYNAQGGDYWWWGAHVSINPGNFYSRFHFNYFGGNTDDIMDSPQLTAEDPSAWAFVGRAGFRFGPGRIGLRGWYFSGNDDGVEDPTPEWKRWSAIDSWFAPFEIFYKGGRSWANVGFTGATNPGGTAAIALDGSWQVTKKLLLYMIAGYLWFTTEEDKFLYTRFERNGDENDKLGIGFEIDLRATYQIYQHLSLDLGANWFIADKGLEHLDDADRVIDGVVPSLLENGEYDNAYEFFWRLVYTF